MWSYVSSEQRVPKDHPLRPMKVMVDAVLRDLSPRFDLLYSNRVRPSIPPERLLCALLLEGDVAREFFGHVISQARSSDPLSSEHFTVDGTMIEAWAGQKSFVSKSHGKPPAGRSSRNRDVDFRGQRRTNDEFWSTTDRQALMFRKGTGKETKLCYLGHLLTENRHGLIVDTRTTIASSSAQREAALDMLESLAGKHRATIGADKRLRKPSSEAERESIGNSH